MKKITFIIAGLVCLAIVLSGFAVTFTHRFITALLLIAIGGVAFYLVQRRARKEKWWGKPAT